MSYSANKRKKNLPLVFNRLDCPDNSQPFSATNIPTGLRERNDSTLSANFGTDRPLLNGKCIIWNVSVKINITANNGDISSVSALDETGAIVAMTLNYVTDHYEITGVDTNKYWNIKCWANGVTPTTEEKNSYTLAESGGASNLLTWFKCDSESTTELFAAYDGGVDGTIINYYAGLWGTQNKYSWLDELGYTLSDGSSYYYDIALTELIPAGVLIPRLESVTAPPFKCAAYVAGGVRGDLEFIGAAPSRGEFKDANGILFEGTSKLVIPYNALLDVQNIEFEFWFEHTNGVIEEGYFLNRWNNLGGAVFRFLNSSSTEWEFSIRDSANLGVSISFPAVSVINVSGLNIVKGRKYGTNVELEINGNLVSDTSTNTGIVSRTTDYVIGQREDSSTVFPLSNTIIYNVIIRELDSLGAYVGDIGRWPLPEYILAPSTHTAYDVSGNGNNATLVNGSTANRGLQSEFFYDHLGTLDDGVNQQVPILSDLSAFADGTLLTDPDAILQDGNSFLNTGTKIAAVTTPRLVQAEQINRFFTDTSDVIINKNHSDFTGDETGNQDFNDVSETNEVKNIRKHHKALTGIQLKTEKIITNN